MMPLQDFLNKWFGKKKVTLDFETRDPNPFGLHRVRLAYPSLFEERYERSSGRVRQSHLSPDDFKILRETCERMKMKDDLKTYWANELDRLKQIIESNEPTDLKIDRILLWQRQKRSTELHNLIRYKQIKLDHTIHAEMNALLFSRCDVSGMTLYVWPYAPCVRCAVHIIQAGIGRVVAPMPLYYSSWAKSQIAGIDAFREVGIKLDYFACDELHDRPKDTVDWP